MPNPVEKAKQAREKLVARRRAIIEDAASVDRVSIDYAADLKIIQEAIDVLDRVIGEEQALQSDLYETLSGAD